VAYLLINHGFQALNKKTAFTRRVKFELA